MEVFHVVEHLLQTGGDKTTIQVQKWAVATVEARHEEKSGDAEK